MNTQNIKIEDLTIDPALQARECLNQEVVDDYSELWLAGTIFPPISVINTGKELLVVDGFHRVKAAQKIGILDIPSVLTDGSRRDAILIAVGANQDHGLYRSNADKRKAVKTLLDDIEWSEWSDREIAKHCAVSPTFVGNLRVSLSTVDSEKPISRTYTSKHGTKSVMNLENLSKPKSEGLPPVLTYEDGLLESSDHFNQLLTEIEGLRSQLAVAHLKEATEDEKNAALKIIEDLRKENQLLKEELRVIKATRQVELEEHNIVIGKWKHWEKKAKKLEKDCSSENA